MDKTSFVKIRFFATGAISIAIWSLLVWNYYHGGVTGHHLLADKSMPRISNGWGALVIPLLAWFLTYRVQQRIFPHQVSQIEKATMKSVIYAFLFSLLYGIMLSLFFVMGYPGITSYMTLAIFAVALFFPVYRAECFLGYVLGLTFSFGAVIPTTVGSLIVLICFVMYGYVRKAILYIGSLVFK